MLVMSKLEEISPKPTAAVVRSKADKVKKKYGLDLIRFTDNDETALIYVKHKEQDNTRNILEVPLMSASDRAVLVTAAMSDLQSRCQHV